jgi:tetratricopeptide (TPR) repeat protein
MHPTPMRMPLLIGVLMVLCAYVGYQYWVVYRRWKSRRRLEAEGTLQRGTNRGTMIFVCLFAGAFILAVANVKFGLGLESISAGHVLLGCVVFAVVFVAIRMFFVKRDRVAWRANAMVRKKQFDEAIEYLRSEMLRRPKTGLQCAILGSALAQRERWEEAAEAYREARELSPKLLVAAVTEAEALKKLGRAEEALSRLETVRSAHPNQAALAYAVAKVLAEMGRMDEAGERLRQGDEIGHAAPNEQRVDFISTVNLRKGCLELIKGPSVRGFPVEKC